jgi:hypothetical protein
LFCFVFIADHLLWPPHGRSDAQIDRSVHGYTAPPKNRNNNNNNNGEYSLQVLNRFNKKSSSGLLEFLSLSWAGRQSASGTPCCCW